METGNKKRCAQIVTWTLLAWLLVVIGMATAFVWSNLALPPSGDSYANGTFFQVLNFVYVRGPALLLILLGVLASEGLGCWIFARRRTAS